VKKVIGIFFVATPFVVGAITAWNMPGGREALLILLTAVAAMACFIGGSLLIASSNQTTKRKD
jgi:hypothetical protein